jgi:hypothetical protein
MQSFDLIHGENILSIFDFKYSKEDVKGGNPYNTTFMLKIISGVFQGVGEFVIDIKQFKNFIQEINYLYDFKVNEVLLEDIGYGSKVQFDIKKTGHIEISGEIYGDAALNSLKFNFYADQTSLKIFADTLKNIL